LNDIINFSRWRRNIKNIQYFFQFESNAIERPTKPQADETENYSLFRSLRSWAVRPQRHCEPGMNSAGIHASRRYVVAGAARLISVTETAHDGERQGEE